MNVISSEAALASVPEADRAARHAREAAMIAQADASFAAGRFVDEAAVDAWIDSIGTENELPAPYSGR